MTHLPHQEINMFLLALSLCDVEIGANHTLRPASAVTKYLAASRHPTQFAVAQEAIFPLLLWPRRLEPRFQERLKPWKVLRVNQPRPTLIAVSKRAAFKPEKALKLRSPYHAVAFGIPVKDADMPGFLGKSRPFLAFPQRLLCLLEIVDVEAEFDNRSVLKAAPAEQHPGTGTVFEKILLFVRANNTGVAQLFPVPLTEFDPFRRGHCPPGELSCFDVSPRITCILQEDAVGVDNTPILVEEKNADGFGL